MPSKRDSIPVSALNVLTCPAFVYFNTNDGVNDMCGDGGEDDYH